MAMVLPHVMSAIITLVLSNVKKIKIEGGRMNKAWIPIVHKLPPENMVVETKIDDEKGCRNQEKLYRQGNLWFLPDGSMYVYYTPTHWRSSNQIKIFGDKE